MQKEKGSAIAHEVKQAKTSGNVFSWVFIPSCIALATLLALMIGLVLIPRASLKASLNVAEIKSGSPSFKNGFTPQTEIPYAKTPLNPYAATLTPFFSPTVQIVPITPTPAHPTCPFQGIDGTLQAAASLEAFYQNGQTFLTWPERTDLTGERYRIYRSNCPITHDNLAQASLLAEVGKDSARFYVNRYNVNNSNHWEPRYSDRLIIRNNDRAISADTGLLVWTLAPEDFGGADHGEGYYAVSVKTPGSRTDLDFLLTTGPVKEAIAHPKPVEITSSPGVNPGPGGHVYIQYMDLRHWNGTFHAPNPSNLYYGLDPADPNLAGTLQYAYDYTVYEPLPGNCQGKVPEKVPVIYWLHGWRANSYWALKKNDQAYCAYVIYPIDVTETWYFGFARHHDYRQPGDVEAGDVIENFTEQRVLRMLSDLEFSPPGPKVDQQRIYVYGQSMGASGALAFAERYPNVFAAAYASQPITNYLTAGVTKQDWAADAAIKWGKPALNLPIAVSAPDDWAVLIQKYNGVGIWDWQNYQANLSGIDFIGRIADDMAPIGITHGIKDHVVLFSTQGQPTYQALNDGLRVWGGVVNASDHLWQYFIGLPISMIQLPNKAPFWNLGVIRDESVPAISNLSSNASLPPQDNNSYNMTVKWSSSWDPWDGAPIDEADRWQISLCSVAPGLLDCGTGRNVTLDVTPRRLQHFKMFPLTQYDWQNIQLSNGKSVAEGTIMSDKNGLITIKTFMVSPEGNRLMIKPHT